MGQNVSNLVSSCQSQVQAALRPAGACLWHEKEARRPGKDGARVKVGGLGRGCLGRAYP